MRRGFSLLEALAALVLAGLVTAGVALAFRTGLDASRRLRERTEAHAEGRAVLDELCADLASAFLSGANTAETYFQALPPEEAKPGEPFLSFTSLSYRRARGAGVEGQAYRSDAVRVEYSLSRPGGGLSDEPQVLVRRERWLTESGRGQTDVVCERVAGLRLRFPGGGEADDRWDSAPPQDDPKLAVREGEDGGAAGDRQLPKAVEITLLLAPGRGDRPGQPPRVYRTTVALRADGAPPFEPETVLSPPMGQDQDSAGQGGAGNGAGNGGRGG